MKVAVIGAGGFVGSAFVRYLKKQRTTVDLTEVTRATYDLHAGNSYDVVIHCAGNSKKFFAEENPFEEFDASVGIVIRSLRDFPADFHILISSVDVYADLSSPETTQEDSTRTAVSSTHYGFHKFLAEEIIRHHAKSWLIFRLAGMIGPGLKKNPVFDLLNGLPLRIHPDSRYQYLMTDEAADLCWKIVQTGIRNDAFNVCGSGTLAMTEIAHLLGIGTIPPTNAECHEPRVVNINMSKLFSRVRIPESRDSITAFAASQP